MQSSTPSPKRGSQEESAEVRMKASLLEDGIDSTEPKLFPSQHPSQTYIQQVASVKSSQALHTSPSQMNTSSTEADSRPAQTISRGQQASASQRNEFEPQLRKRKTTNTTAREARQKKPKERAQRTSTRIKKKMDQQYNNGAANSEEQRLIAVALELSMHTTQNACEKLKNELDDLQDTYTYYATQEDMANPILMVERLYRDRIGIDWGTIKIVPPATFNPPCMLDFDFKLSIPTRKQKLQDLTQGKPFRQNNKGYIFSEYQQMAKLFSKNQATYQKFQDIAPDIDNDQSQEFEEIKAVEQEKSSEQKNPVSGQTRSEILRTEFEYWKKVDLKIGDPIEVEYAADLPSKSYGSGFPRGYHSNSKFQRTVPKDWLRKCKTSQEEFLKYQNHPINLNYLNCQEGSLLKFLDGGQGISGITSPWTYLGMKYATFCWHTEDLMMYSMNFMHKGNAKIWYCIPEFHANKFQKLMKAQLQSLKRNEPNFIHHMTTMMSPTFLKNNGIQVYRLVQNPREFVLTFPRSYHAGFSTGFNIGEAVNFSSLSWLDHGIKSFEIYKKTKEVIPIFSLEYLVCQNLSLYQKDGERKLRVSKIQQQKEGYAKFKAEVNKQNRKRIFQEAVQLFQKQISNRIQLRRQLALSGGQWKQTKMHDNTGYDKYECKFCTDLPYFSAIIYEQKRGQKKFKACLDHCLLYDRLKSGELKAQVKLRMTDQQLQENLEYAKLQIQQ